MALLPKSPIAVSHRKGAGQKSSAALATTQPCVSFLQDKAILSQAKQQAQQDLAIRLWLRQEADVGILSTAKGFGLLSLHA